MRRRLPACLPLLLHLLGCSTAPIADQQVLADQGPRPIGTRELMLVDRSRPTPANGAAPGTAERRLPTRVWYPATADGGPPAADGPFPLIAYAHGFTADRGTGRPFGEHLASHGYIVAAPDFPLSSGAAPGGPTLADLPSQPADLAFVLRSVAELGGEDAALGRAVDRTRLGLLGLSLGGATVLVGAYHPSLRLMGVSAVVAQAPLSCAFGAAFYSRPLPTLIMAGDADQLVRFAGGPARSFALAPAPARLLRLRGGNHVGFVGIEAGQGNADDLGCAIVGASDRSAGLAEALRLLAQGAPAGVVDPGTCDSTVCPERLPQTMTAARQLELARAATLAHFEATLRGRADAERLLSTGLAAGNADVEVQGKE